MNATIGNARFEFAGGHLSITSVADPLVSVATPFDPEHVEQLIEFLTTLPDASADRRNAFRVHLDERSGVRVRLARGKTRVSVVPQDISMVGMRIGVDENLAAALTVDDHVTLHIDFNRQRLDLRGKVKRLYTDNCGILFADAITGGEVTPPPALSAMVMELQRRWLTDISRRAPPKC